MTSSADQFSGIEQKKITFPYINRGSPAVPIDDPGNDDQWDILPYAPIEPVSTEEHPDGGDLMGCCRAGYQADPALYSGVAPPLSSLGTGTITNGGTTVKVGEIGTAYIDLYRPGLHHVSKIQYAEAKDTKRFPHTTNCLGAGSSYTTGQDLTVLTMLPSDVVDDHSNGIAMAFQQVPLLFKGLLTGGSGSSVYVVGIMLSNDFSDNVTDLFDDDAAFGDMLWVGVDMPGVGDTSERTWADNDRPLPIGQCWLVSHGYYAVDGDKWALGKYAGGRCDVEGVVGG